MVFIKNRAYQKLSPYTQLLFLIRIKTRSSYQNRGYALKCIVIPNQKQQ
ncbi:MAG: hypothetical protein ACLFQP_11615 [Halothece sp.]